MHFHYSFIARQEISVNEEYYDSHMISMSITCFYHFPQASPKYTQSRYPLNIQFNWDLYLSFWPVYSCHLLLKASWLTFIDRLDCITVWNHEWNNDKNVYTILYGAHDDSWNVCNTTVVLYDIVLVPFLCRHWNPQY